MNSFIQYYIKDILLAGLQSRHEQLQIEVQQLTAKLQEKDAEVSKIQDLRVRNKATTSSTKILLQW